MESRFSKLAKRKGFKITRIGCIASGLVMTRPDIYAVEKHGEFVMTIPRYMYPWFNPNYKDIIGIPQPSFFNCEEKLYNYGK